MDTSYSPSLQQHIPAIANQLPAHSIEGCPIETPPAFLDLFSSLNTPLPNLNSPSVAYADICWRCH